MRQMIPLKDLPADCFDTIGIGNLIMFLFHIKSDLIHSTLFDTLLASEMFRQKIGQNLSYVTFPIETN